MVFSGYHALHGNLRRLHRRPAIVLAIVLIYRNALFSSEMQRIIMEDPMRRMGSRGLATYFPEVWCRMGSKVKPAGSQNTTGDIIQKQID